MDTQIHPASAGTILPIQEAIAASVASRPPTKPEFFPMPQRGPDPHFSLCRSSYYDLERAGLLRLVRVRKPGNVRGKVLIPFDVTSPNRAA